MNQYNVWNFGDGDGGSTVTVNGLAAAKTTAKLRANVDFKNWRHELKFKPSPFIGEGRKVWHLFRRGTFVAWTLEATVRPVNLPEEG